MTVSSRTPEGFPSNCPVCGASVRIEFSDPANDAPCPQCGCLLWFSTELVNSLTNYSLDALGTTASSITVDSRFAELDGDSLDSLDLVELVMKLEDEYDIVIPDNDYDQIQTIGDVVRLVNVKRRGKSETE
ncbi:phosphopantetheine-binding protein [Gimesia fumaroli]|uniref:Acyl carrier protein n=1 Tax=Gimesia fumaroli TaxID=2527976 RepID=A0A518II34_9PLAN|nr:phosphopantetheine-binding protein [Gimesia fumaroli]QDV52749.1 Acyl carrier protein [Gimesia fumaroli]